MFEQRHAEIRQRQLELQLRSAELRAHLSGRWHRIDERWQGLARLLQLARDGWQGAGLGRGGTIGAVVLLTAALAAAGRGAASAGTGLQRGLGLLREGLRLWRLWQQLSREAAPAPAAPADEAATAPAEVRQP